MDRKFSEHLELAQNYWKQILQRNDIAIDATCGNGQDTLFLSALCDVFAIDIQEKAVESTRALVPSASVFCMSHEAIDTLPLPSPPRLIVYNLGYLPKGDKGVTTLVKSTLISVEKGLHLLQKGGALSIMCYPGHDEGALEEKALTEWARRLPSDKWAVSHHQWINRNRSPSLLWVKGR